MSFSWWRQTLEDQRAHLSFEVGILNGWNSPNLIFSKFAGIWSRSLNQIEPVIPAVVLSRVHQGQLPPHNLKVSLRYPSSNLHWNRLTGGLTALYPASVRRPALAGDQFGGREYFSPFHMPRVCALGFSTGSQSWSHPLLDPDCLLICPPLPQNARHNTLLPPPPLPRLARNHILWPVQKLNLAKPIPKSAQMCSTFWTQLSGPVSPQ